MFFRKSRIDLVAWDQESFFLTSDQILTGTIPMEAWVAGQTVHPSMAILEEIPQVQPPDPVPAPHGEFQPAWPGRAWVEEMAVLIERLGRPARKHWYRAELKGPEQFRESLEILLEPAPHQSVEHRRSPRLPHHFRVLSSELPKFKGTVRDISATGIGLDLAGAVQRGARVQLKLEPEGKVKPFLMVAEICWCRPTQRPASTSSRASSMIKNTHLFEAGARFVEIDEVNRQILLDYLAMLESKSDPTTFTDRYVR